MCFVSHLGLQRKSLLIREMPRSWFWIGLTEASGGWTISLAKQTLTKAPLRERRNKR